MSIRLKDVRNLVSQSRPEIPQYLLDSCYTIRDLKRLVKTVDVLKAVPTPSGAFTRPTGPAEPQMAYFKQPKLPQEVFTLTLETVGDNTIGAIKAVREITNLGLRESKDLVDKTRGMYSPSWGGPREVATPQVIHATLNTEKANRARKLLAEVGCGFKVEEVTA